MLEHPQSGDNIFCKVKNDSSIILIDSFGNEPKAKDVSSYYINKVKNAQMQLYFNALTTKIVNNA